MSAVEVVLVVGLAVVAVLVAVVLSRLRRAGAPAREVPGAACMKSPIARSCFRAIDAAPGAGATFRSVIGVHLR